MHALARTLGCKPLPWRLTPRQIDEVDRRVCNIVYPHGIKGVSKDGKSFLKKPGCTWRTADKLTALLYILPTVLRGFAPAVRAGFRKIILGLRILEGRCINDSEGVRMRVRAGSRPISDEDIERADLLIIEGLSMLEGVCTSCLKVSVCRVCVILENVCVSCVCDMLEGVCVFHGCVCVCHVCVMYVCVSCVSYSICVSLVCVVYHSLKPNPFRHHHRMQSQRFHASMCARFYSLR